MFALLRGRIDPVAEHWILWELPLTRALQYHHAALRYAGEWTVPIDLVGDKEKLDAVEAAIAKAKVIDEDLDELF